MHELERPAHTSFAEALARARPRLVTLCARVTGDVDAAEDLAQETLLEAWRRLDTIRNPERVEPWLYGIARNMSLRWLRTRGREQTIRDERLRDGLDPGLDAVADTIDLERDLERAELIDLLDRALDLLPVDMREALIARYVRGERVGEIAARSGVSVAAAGMRLNRGKQALRKALTTDLRHELDPYIFGLPDVQAVSPPRWRQTPLWCFVCGRRRLLGSFAGGSALLLACPQCAAGARTVWLETCPEIFGLARGYSRALEQTFSWIESYYGHLSAAPHSARSCYICGHPLPPARLIPLASQPWASLGAYGFYHLCPHCSAEASQPLAGLALASSAGSHFRHKHARVRTLPDRTVEIGDRTLIVTHLAAATSGAWIEIAFAADSGRFVQAVQEC